MQLSTAFPNTRFIRFSLRLKSHESFLLLQCAIQLAFYGVWVILARCSELHPSWLTCTGLVVIGGPFGGGGFQYLCALIFVCAPIDAEIE